MAQILRQSTQVVVVIGPFVDVTDGFTPETGITLGAADEAEILKANTTTTTDISAATWAAITGCDGWYGLTLTTTHTDTVGALTVMVNDDSVCLPVFARFQVIEEAAYDAMYAASADPKADINVASIDAGAITAAAIATGAIDADALAADAVAEIADGVWDEDATGHQTQGTFGQAIGDPAADSDSIWALVNTNLDATVSSRLATAGYTAPPSAATIADAVWDEDATAHQTQGSFGQVLGDSGADADSVWSLANTNLDATVSSRLATAGYTAPPSAASISDAVWEEAIADHSGTVGSTAEQLAAAGAAGDPWATAIPGAYGAGTAGKIVGDNLNATVSSRASQASVDTVDTNVDSILADTGTDGVVLAANSVTAAAVAADAVTEIQSGLATAANLATVDTVVDGIKAKTDSLTFTVAGQVDANVQGVNDTNLQGVGTAGDPWRPA
jgi:hypothetical protein